MAHTRHVNSIHWHPERMNILASGGSDKAIRIWDMSSNNYNNNDNHHNNNRQQKQHINNSIELQALASVSQVKWRPNYPTQIASTCVEVDYAISLWDVHSPHVPKQIFRGHIDAVPDIIWLPPESENKESHLLACSRDESIGLHGFEKAYDPSENATRNGISISPKHDIAMVTNKYDIVSTSLLNMDINTKQMKKKRFKYLARHYKSKLDNTLKTYTDICENNRKACLAVNLPTIAQTWAVVGVLLREQFGNNDMENNNSNNKRNTYKKDKNKNGVMNRNNNNNNNNINNTNNTNNSNNNNNNNNIRNKKNKLMSNGNNNNNKKKKDKSKHHKLGKKIKKNNEYSNKMKSNRDIQLIDNKQNSSINTKIKLSNKNFSFGITSTENDETTDDDRLYIDDDDDDDDGGSSMSLLLQPSPRSRHTFGGSNSNAPESTIADFQDAKSTTDNSYGMGSEFDDDDDDEMDNDNDTGDTFSMLIQQLDRANPTGASAFIKDDRARSTGSNIITAATNGIDDNNYNNGNYYGFNSSTMNAQKQRRRVAGRGGGGGGGERKRGSNSRNKNDKTIMIGDHDDRYQDTKSITDNSFMGSDDDDYESMISDKDGVGSGDYYYDDNEDNGNYLDKRKKMSTNRRQKIRNLNQHANGGTIPGVSAMFTMDDRTGTTTMRKSIILSLLDYYSNIESDLQFCAILADLSINAGIDINRQRAETWFHAYIEALHKHNLAIVATEFVKNMKGSAGQLNQASTTIYSYCNVCSRPLQPSLNSICDKCNGKNLARCVICEQRVRGQYMWCQRCGHGGHLNHMTKWFEKNVECPSGCGCKCWS